MKLSEAQLAALRSARDHGDIGHHIKGRSASGGFTRTRRSLYYHGLIDWQNHLTSAGQQALEAASAHQTAER